MMDGLTFQAPAKTWKHDDPRHPFNIWFSAPRGQKRAKYIEAIQEAYPDIPATILRSAMRLCEPRQCRFITCLVDDKSPIEALHNARTMQLGERRKSW